MSELVSVITPAYNRARYLPETIESVLAQDYPHIEHLVLDDGSTDNTADVLKQYSGRIRWESHPNMGESRTVNKGWGMAKGEYIVTVNSDDPILPGLIRTGVEFMREHPEVLVAYPGYVVIDENSQVIREPRMYNYNYLNMLRWHYCFPGVGTLMRRKVLELEPVHRDPTYRYRSDFDFWLRVGLHGPMALIPQRLATWRSHSQGLTSGMRGNLMVAAETARVIEKLYVRPDLPREVQQIKREALAVANNAAALKCLPEERGAARRYFLRSLWLCPFGSFKDSPHNYRRWGLLWKTILLSAGAQQWFRNVRRGVS